MTAIFEQGSKQRPASESEVLIKTGPRRAGLWIAYDKIDKIGFLLLDNSGKAKFITKRIPQGADKRMGQPRGHRIVTLD